MPDDVPEGSARSSATAERIGELAADRDLTVACAESLTSGALAARLGAAPGSAGWFRGGIVAYSRAVKHSLLRVPEGPVVCESAARAMAESTVDLLGADVAVAVTGAGGPDSQDGQEPGTVWFGVAGRGPTHAEEKFFPGEPEEVLAETVFHALTLLAERVGR